MNAWYDQPLELAPCLGFYNSTKVEVAEIFKVKHGHWKRKTVLR
jgi:hypothetical protein